MWCGANVRPGGSQAQAHPPTDASARPYTANLPSLPAPASPPSGGLVSSFLCLRTCDRSAALREGCGAAGGGGRNRQLPHHPQAPDPPASTRSAVLTALYGQPLAGTVCGTDRGGCTGSRSLVQCQVPAAQRTTSGGTRERTVSAGASERACPLGERETIKVTSLDQLYSQVTCCPLFNARALSGCVGA
eukprot:394809-Rhodomonas_salina.3